MSWARTKCGMRACTQTSALGMLGSAYSAMSSGCITIAGTSCVMDTDEWFCQRGSSLHVLAQNITVTHDDVNSEVRNHVLLRQPHDDRQRRGGCRPEGLHQIGHVHSQSDAVACPALNAKVGEYCVLLSRRNHQESRQPMRREREHSHRPQRSECLQPCVLRRRAHPHRGRLNGYHRNV